MNAAMRETTAKERAIIAAEYIRLGATSGLEFEGCFEGLDGLAVVFYLLEDAKSDARILAFAERCRWTAPGFLPATFPEVGKKIAAIAFGRAKRTMAAARSYRERGGDDAAFFVPACVADAREKTRIGRRWQNGQGA